MKRLHVADKNLFWYWISERHSIYLNRKAGKPKPWSDDPIFQQYKFTNVFRQLDRGTVWLTDNFIAPHWNDPLDLIVFNCCWYRFFNWTGTGERLGWQTSWRASDWARKLRSARRRGEQVFTGAHIVWGPKGQDKVGGVLSNCTAAWKARHDIVNSTRFYRTLEGTFEELKKVQGCGDFIAYEIVTDLRHTRLLNKARDINRWANVGPGALRGLRRLDPTTKASHGLHDMRALLQESVYALPEHVPQLELRDIEHSLCEFDKYCRVKFKEGRPRSTYPGTAEVTV